MENIVVVPESNKKSKIWNQRLDHMSEKMMKVLFQIGSF